MINSISFGKFFKKYPNHVVTRDYLTIKIWDIRSTSKQPSSSIHVTDYIEKNLLSLYEEDAIYDKFFLDISPCNNYVVSGGYNKSGHVIDVNGTNNVSMAANFDMKRGKVVGVSKKYNANKRLPPAENVADLKKKVMQGCWSPIENIVALAFRNCIFLYSDKVK